MSDTPLWQVSVACDDVSRAFDVAEEFGFLSDAEALSVSVFEADGGTSHSVQAIFDMETAAHRAADQIGGHVGKLPETDWVSETQKRLAPIRAGRFYVHGSHDTPLDEDGVQSILIDAGLAFGTGHHGTTKGCLKLFDTLSETETFTDILDLGTGSGVLAIAAAKRCPDAKILATDIDQDAVDVTRHNMALNGTHFNAIKSDGFQDPALSHRHFDLIFANILAGPLRTMADDIFAVTQPGGTAILSGILDEQADWVGKRFITAGYTIKAQPSLDGWTTLLAIRLDR